MSEYAALNPAVRTLGGGEVNDVAVALEHVHLLNGLDGLDIELLEGGLELLVITAGPGRGALDLPAGSSLATMYQTVRFSFACTGSSRMARRGCILTYPMLAHQSAVCRIKGGGRGWATRPGGRRTAGRHTNTRGNTELLQSLLNIIHVGGWGGGAAKIEEWWSG